VDVSVPGIYALTYIAIAAAIILVPTALLTSEAARSAHK
jgi:hypothetical protein